jgi:type IV pilus assembly protein PilN
MARISLVPWREKRREQRKRDFIMFLGAGAVATLLVMGLWHLINQSMIDNQIDRNNLLRKEIQVVDAKLAEIKRLDETKQRLLARMELIQSLQESRPKAVRLMDDIVLMMPEGVVLSSIKQSGNNISIEGNAQSNAQISALMRNIEETEWLARPTLRLIESKDTEGLNRFSLTMQQDKREPRENLEETESAEVAEQ